MIYFVKNIRTDDIEDNAVTLDKISRYGVLPTDIFRIDTEFGFDMSGCGLGGIMVQAGVGGNTYYFSYDSSHPDNPYRLSLYYDSTFPKILAFAPVIPVIPNVNKKYSVCASFVHYNAGNINCQVIIQLNQTVYNSLYEGGKRYLKGTIKANIYDYEGQEVPYSVALNRVNFININFTRESLQHNNYQHIILSLVVNASDTQ